MRSRLLALLSRVPLARRVVRSLRSLRLGMPFYASLIRRGGLLRSTSHAVLAQVALRSEPEVDVVVLGSADVARRLSRQARLRVHQIDPSTAEASDLSDLHREMRLMRRLGVIVDALQDDGQERRLRELLYYLRPHGRYVIVDANPATIELVRDLDRIRKEPRFSPDEGRVGVAQNEPSKAVARRRLAGAVLDQHLLGHSVVIHKRLQHLLKMRESDMTPELVETRMAGWLTEQQLAPASTVTEVAPLTLNRPDLAWKFPKRLEIPPMMFRTYEDVTCAPRQIVFRDNFLLPDAIRLNTRPYPEQIHTRDVDARFARLPRTYRNLPVLKGSYYYLDDEHPDVYGHLLTDMSGRLWGWEHALEQDPDVKLLVSTRSPDKTELPGWMLDLLEHYGIGRDRIQVLNRPARVERLLAVTPQFMNFFFGYAAPAISEVWDRWRDRVLATRPIPETPRRVFITRPSGGTRECRNAPEVEQFFADAGFEVIRPELHDLHTQVALFANAEQLAGFGGSAMLNAIFRGRDRPMLVLQPETHHAVNEYLIASVYGDPVTQHFSPAELAGSAPGNARYQSPFTVDLAGDGELLREFAAIRSTRSDAVL